MHGLLSITSPRWFVLYIEVLLESLVSRPDSRRRDATILRNKAKFTDSLLSPIEFRFTCNIVIEVFLCPLSGVCSRTTSLPHTRCRFYCFSVGHGELSYSQRTVAHYLCAARAEDVLST